MQTSKHNTPDVHGPDGGDPVEEVVGGKQYVLSGNEEGSNNCFTQFPPAGVALPQTQTSRVPTTTILDPPISIDTYHAHPLSTPRQGTPTPPPSIIRAACSPPLAQTDKV